MSGIYVIKFQTNVLLLLLHELYIIALAQLGVTLSVAIILTKKLFMIFILIFIGKENQPSVHNANRYFYVIRIYW